MKHKVAFSQTGCTAEGLSQALTFWENQLKVGNKDAQKNIDILNKEFSTLSDAWPRSSEAYKQYKKNKNR